MFQVSIVSFVLMSNILILRLFQRDVGSIYLDEGAVQFAAVNGDETVPPEKAFYRILVWDTGTFDLLPKVEREFPQSIQMSIEGLLMEGMRQLDEIRRIGDALPGLQAPISVSSPLATPLRDASPEELDVVQLALNQNTLADMMNHTSEASLKTEPLWRY